ncbi:MAG TPA: hypothetical protein ENG11_02850 [candidate division Zixibacteria bacterium]|nr:hypothetical protein [candidate division Zixibacteria bacterium]
MISILDITTPTNPTVVKKIPIPFKPYVARCADTRENVLAIAVEPFGRGQGRVVLYNLLHFDDSLSLHHSATWMGEGGYNIEDMIVCSKYIIITQWNDSASCRGRILSLEYDDVTGCFIAPKDTLELWDVHPYGIAKGVYRMDDTLYTLYFYVALGPDGVGTYKLRLVNGTIEPGGTWTKTDTTKDVRDVVRYGNRLFMYNHESDSTNIVGIIVAPIDTTTWMPTDTIAVYPARYVRAVWADSTRVYYIGDMSKGSGTAPGAR